MHVKNNCKKIFKGVVRNFQSKHLPFLNNSRTLGFFEKIVGRFSEVRCCPSVANHELEVDPVIELLSSNMRLDGSGSLWLVKPYKKTSVIFR